MSIFTLLGFVCVKIVSMEHLVGSKTTSVRVNAEMPNKLQLVPSSNELKKKKNSKEKISLKFEATKEENYFKFQTYFYSMINKN